MANRGSNSSTPNFQPTFFFDAAQKYAETIAGLQKQLIESCEQSGQLWAARAQSEVAMWSELASKMATIRSAPEAVEALQSCMSKRMQMTAEDGEKLVKQWQQLTEKLTKSVSHD